MKIAMIVIAALGALFSLLVLIVACLPSPTVRDLAKRLFDRKPPHTEHDG